MVLSCGVTIKAAVSLILHHSSRMPDSWWLELFKYLFDSSLKNWLNTECQLEGDMNQVISQFPTHPSLSVCLRVDATS
jgi:hypothetical protein